MPSNKKITLRLYAGSSADGSRSLEYVKVFDDVDHVEIEHQDGLVYFYDADDEVRHTYRIDMVLGWDVEDS